MELKKCFYSQLPDLSNSTSKKIRTRQFLLISASYNFNNWKCKQISVSKFNKLINQTWNYTMLSSFQNLGKIVDIFMIFIIKIDFKELRTTAASQANSQINFIDCLLFQCFWNCHAQCIDFFAVKTLHFTCLSINLLCCLLSKHTYNILHRYGNFYMTANLVLRMTITGDKKNKS